MKKLIKVIAGVLVFTTSIFMISCSQLNYKSIKRLQKLEEGVQNPTTKEELLEAISKYDTRAMDLVASQAQVGVWYKILGTRYLDEQMYGKAMEAFQAALLYYPNNENLYYYVGVCAGYLANSQLDYSGSGDVTASLKKQNYLDLSEQAFLQAISINPRYYKALYSIGVLYTFDRGEPEKAIPYLETYLSVQTKETDGMFVLACAYYTDYQFEKAVSLYDRIISINPNPEKTAQATANRQKALDALYSNN